MPDSKDFDAVKNHITMKYKDRKFSIKHPDKELTSNNLKNSNALKKNQESDDDSESDSESEKENAASKNIKSLPISTNANRTNTVMPAPVENPVNKKLTPLNMKSTTNQSNNNSSNNRGSVLEGKSIALNQKNSDWADQKDFTFFNDLNQGASGSNKTQQPTNNTLIDTNLFTFSSSVAVPESSQATNSKKNNMDNEWGLIWDNPSQTTKSPNQNNNFDFFDSNNSIDTNEISSKQTNPAKDTKVNSSISQQSHIRNSLDFNFANVNASSTITSNSNPNTINTSTTNNISALNQNLSSVYSNFQANPIQTNNKKNYDDLDKFLSDPSLFSNTGMNQPQTNYSAQNYGKMNINSMNQAMQGGNSQLMMNPQMIQQMQMMMMNPQMQSNPQMMQYMQMMLNNMMTSNINVNTSVLNNNMTMSPVTNYGGNMHTQSKVDFQFNDLSEMNNLSLSGQNVKLLKYF